MKLFLKEVFKSLLPRRVKIVLFKYIRSKNLFSHLNDLNKLGFNPASVIDIGAYKGEWSYYASQIFANSTFLMIEPQEDKQQGLKEIVEKSKNMRFASTLLGKENNDKVIFYEMETGSSIYAEQTDVGREIKNYRMETLDNLVAKEGIKGEYFIKLDVQGAELDVLKGATKVLEDTNFILLEASLLNYNENAPLFAEVVAYLNEKDFVLFDICDQNRKKDNTLFQVDLIFTKRNSNIRSAVNFNKIA